MQRALFQRLSFARSACFARAPLSKFARRFYVNAAAPARIPVVRQFHVSPWFPHCCRVRQVQHQPPAPEAQADEPGWPACYTFVKSKAFLDETDFPFAGADLPLPAVRSHTEHQQQQQAQTMDSTLADSQARESRFASSSTELMLEKQKQKEHKINAKRGRDEESDDDVRVAAVVLCALCVAVVACVCRVCCVSACLRVCHCVLFEFTCFVWLWLTGARK